MISPGAIVSDVHPLLAAGAGGDECAVDVEDGFVEEVGRLLLPDLEPGLIEDILKALDVVGGEAAAEVAGGGGVGDAVGPEGVKED
jgi:ABC-type methionine transport system permease subunit